MPENPGQFVGTCEECGRLIRANEHAKGDTRGHVWCARCEEKAEYFSDPFNRAYERARARGWED